MGAPGSKTCRTDHWSGEREIGGTFLLLAGFREQLLHEARRLETAVVREDLGGRDLYVGALQDVSPNIVPFVPDRAAAARRVFCDFPRGVLLDELDLFRVGGALGGIGATRRACHDLGGSVDRYPEKGAIVIVAVERDTDVRILQDVANLL